MENKPKPKAPKGAKKPKEAKQEPAEKLVSLKPLKPEEALSRALKPVDNRPPHAQKG